MRPAMRSMAIYRSVEFPEQLLLAEEIIRPRAL
jgi:hypothetical protein